MRNTQRGAVRKSEFLKFAALIFSRFADLPQLLQCADLLLAVIYVFFAICGFVICEPNYFADIKLPQIHNFSPYKYKLKMLFQFKDDSWNFVV